VVSGPEEMAVEAVRRLEVIADTYLSVNTPVQHSLPGLFAPRAEIQGQVLGRLVVNKLRIQQSAGSEGPCRCLPIEGGWSAVLQIPRTRSDEEWALLLLQEERVVTHPGYFFDFPTEGQ